MISLPDCDECKKILGSHLFVKRRGKKGERQRQIDYLWSVHFDEHVNKKRTGGYTNDSVAT